MATDASTDPALDAAIRAIPSWEGKELEIVPIAEGRTNRNFRVTAGDEAFFLRLSEKSTELLGIDRNAEQDSVAGGGPGRRGARGVRLPPGPRVPRHAMDRRRAALRRRPRARGGARSRGRCDQGDPRGPGTRRGRSTRSGSSRTTGASPRSAASSSPRPSTSAHEKAVPDRSRVRERPDAAPPVSQRPPGAELHPGWGSALARGSRVRRYGRSVLRPGEPLDQQCALGGRAGADARPVLRRRDGGAPRSAGFDEDDVGLPRGHVGGRATGSVDARHRLRRVRDEPLRPPFHLDGGPAFRRWLETARGI